MGTLKQRSKKSKLVEWWSLRINTTQKNYPYKSLTQVTSNNVSRSKERRNVC